MSYFLTAFKKYAVFSGRAQRKEYWYFWLFYLLLNILVLIVSFAVLGASLKAGMGWTGLKWTFIGYQLFGLLFLLPLLAVTVRRLHDVGKSAWILFIGIPLMLLAQIIIVGSNFLMGIDIPGIPADSYIGPLKMIVTGIGYVFGICYVVWSLWLLLLMITPSQPGVNKYGPHPIEKASTESSRKQI